MNSVAFRSLVIILLMKIGAVFATGTCNYFFPCFSAYLDVIVVKARYIDYMVNHFFFFVAYVLWVYFARALCASVFLSFVCVCHARSTVHMNFVSIVSLYAHTVCSKWKIEHILKRPQCVCEKKRTLIVFIDQLLFSIIMWWFFYGCYRISIDIALIIKLMKRIKIYLQIIYGIKRTLWRV